MKIHFLRFLLDDGTNEGLGGTNSGVLTSWIESSAGALSLGLGKLQSLPIRSVKSNKEGL